MTINKIPNKLDIFFEAVFLEEKVEEIFEEKHMPIEEAE